jgi:hypothetical protein
MVAPLGHLAGVLSTSRAEQLTQFRQRPPASLIIHRRLRTGKYRYQECFFSLLLVLLVQVWSVRLVAVY